VSTSISRRIFGGGLLAATGALAVRRMLSSGVLPDRRRPRSRVAILHKDSYSGPLDRALIEGLRLFDLNLRGKTVLLKPNLVEFIPGAEVNTNPRLVGAAASAFLALGAKTVLVGEGPGHQRDTVLVLAEGGLEAELNLTAIASDGLGHRDLAAAPGLSSTGGRLTMYLLGAAHVPAPGEAALAPEHGPGRPRDALRGSRRASKRSANPVCGCGGTEN
jgi:hypothetical protein